MSCRTSGSTILPSAAAPRRARSAAAAFPFLCAAVFVIYLDATIVNVALPAMQAATDAAIEDLQWLVNGYTLALAALLMSGGAIADRVGRRTVLLGGLAGFGVASTACAVAGSLPWLLAARALQGVSAALIVPPALASLVDCYPDPSRRARAIGRIAAVASLGTAVGPVAGGWLTERIGWQGIFWVNVPIVAATIVGVAITMRGQRSGATRAFDWTGQVLMAGCLGLVTVALIEGNRLGWLSSPLGAMLAGAAALGAAFTIRERRAAQPLWPAVLLHDRSVRVACLSNFLGLMPFFVTQFVLVFWFQRVVGDSPLVVGGRLLWMTIAMMVASPLTGRWIARSGPRRPMLAGTAACAASAVGMTQIPLGLTDAAIDACLVLMGAGVAAIASAATAAVLGGVEPKDVGVASGAASTLRQLGAVVGVALAGGALSGSGVSTPDYAQGLVVALVVAAWSSALLWALAWRDLAPRGRP